MLLLHSLAAAWKQAITEPDNVTTCPLRLSGISVGVAYHLAALWMVFGQGTGVTLPLLDSYVHHMVYLFVSFGGGVIAKSRLGGDATPAS